MTTAYCHCADCRRLTGAPVAAFAAFERIEIHPPLSPRSFAPGVARWACSECGSALAATYDYLPGQTYVPLGILDDASGYAPQMHCHAESAISWLNIADELPRHSASGRDMLTAK